MWRLMLFLAVGAVLAVGGCAGNLASMSAGQIGCAPEDITIENEDFGWGTRSWVARCGERVYHCSSYGGSSYTTSRETVVTMPQVSCRRRGGDAPAAPTYAPPASGCQHDNQCKGERVCVDGSCVAPDGERFPSAPRPAAEADDPPPPSRPAGPPRAPAREQARDSESPPPE